MIKEAYVSFGLAKKLKEKGFSEECRTYYMAGGKFTHLGKFKFSTPNIVVDGEPCYLAPTLQMSMAWLREKHLLHVYAEYKCFCDGMKQKPKPYYHWVPFIKPLPHCKYQSAQNKVYFELDIYCDTYEEACETAIEYALDKIL